MKASSNGMSYVNTQLANHKHDVASFTHWNKISDQPRDGLKFQNHILDRQRSSDVKWVTALARRASKREKGATAINHARKRDSAWSDVIKTVTLNQPTTDSTIVLKTGNRQTDRQTKYIFTVWQTLSFQSREHRIGYDRRRYLHALSSKLLTKDVLSINDPCGVSHFHPWSQIPDWSTNFQKKSNETAKSKKRSTRLRTIRHWTIFWKRYQP